MTEEWKVITSRTHCFSLSIEDGKAMCYHEKGSKYCKKESCPIREKIKPIYTTQRYIG